MSSSPAYSLGIRAYGLAIRLAALWRNDARRWVEARKRPEHHYTRVLRGLPEPETAPRVWLHCASLGEYEQGLPVLEAVVEALSAETGKPCQGVISFFSPSGLEAVAQREQPYPLLYLPLDTPEHAEAFARVLQADVGLVVKYEFWLNHLAAVQATGTRLHLISAHFRPDQVFFGASWKPWTGWFLDGLRCFAAIHCQTAASLALLESIPSLEQNGGVQLHMAGDTRMDRVVERASGGSADPILEAFARRGPVFIAGSTWPEDDALLGELATKVLLPKGWRLIVAPHHVDASSVEQALRHYPSGSRRWSDMAAASKHPIESFDADGNACPVLVVDRIGLLADAYRLGHLAYIGGGFGEGIHNTLEAAVYGLPMAFGPRWQKFAEAGDLIGLGAAQSIADAGELDNWASAMLPDVPVDAPVDGPIDAPILSPSGQAAGAAAKTYVDRHAGASRRICRELLKDWRAKGPGRKG